jgi:hypothetical protein
MNTTVASPRPGVEPHVRRADYRAGLLAGLVAGIAMSPVMMAISTFMMGMGPWPAAKMAWSLVQGPDVIRPGFELVPVMAGMAVHLMLSAAFGLVFAWLASLIPMGAVALGTLYGLGLYVTNILLVPTLFPGWAGHMLPKNATMHLMMALEHAFFGFILGLAYRAWRRP